MPEKETPAEYNWSVVTRHGSLLPGIRAAYVHSNDCTVELKDARHKTVFFAPLDSLDCIERGGRLDESSDDLEEAGELQAEVDRLRAQLAVRTPPWSNTSTGTWTWPATVTYNFPTMGAAGVGYPWTFTPASAGEGGTEGDDGTTGVPVA